MKHVNCVLEIPNDVWHNIQMGSEDLNEAVIRNSDNKRFNQFVNISFDNNSNDDANLNGDAAAFIAMGAAGAIIIAGAAWGVYKLVTYVKGKDEREFNRALQNYIDECNNDRINVEVIDKLITSLGNLKLKGKSKILIESDTLMKLLTNMYNVTVKLMETEGKQVPELTEKPEDNIVRFVDYLNIQKKAALMKINL